MRHYLKGHRRIDRTPGALTPHASSRSGYLAMHVSRNRYLYLMIVPALAWLIVFQYIPMYGLVMAFQDFTIRDGYFRSPFVGLDHFRWLFSNRGFVQAFLNTWIINVGKLAVGFPSALMLALLLNEVSHSTFKRTIQTLSYLPHFISWVIMAGILGSLFAPGTGAAPRLLGTLGFAEIDVMQNPDLFRPFLIFSHVWKEMGWGSIIYLAAMAGINPQLYEAAHVDGANRLQQMWYVTLPGLRSTMVVVFILNLGAVLTWGFDQVFNLYSPLVYGTGDIIQTYIIRSLQESPNFSRLAAAGFVQSFLGMVLLLTANTLARRFGRASLY